MRIYNVTAGFREEPRLEFVEIPLPAFTPELAIETRLQDLERQLKDAESAVERVQSQIIMTKHLNPEDAVPRNGFHKMG